MECGITAHTFGRRLCSRVRPSQTVFGCHMAGRVIAIKLPVVRLLFSKTLCFARTSQRLLSLSALAQIKITL